MLELHPEDDSMLTQPSGETIAEAPAPQKSAEELTLAEWLGYFTQAPRNAWHLLAEIARERDTTVQPVVVLPAPILLPLSPESLAEPHVVEGRARRLIQLALRVAALLLAIFGGMVMADAPLRTEELALAPGIPFMLLAFAVWLGAELYASRPEIERWWLERGQNTSRLPRKLAFEGRIRWWALGFAVLLSGLAIPTATGNRFTVEGVLFWFGGIVMWVTAFAPTDWSIFHLVDALQARVRRMRLEPTLIALLVIILVGAAFRLTDLTTLPPEMTSDHVEKLLDSQRILDGTTQIFFANNGGREPFQMYAMAVLSRFPGLGMNFNTLKMLAVIEALLTLPVMWWFGREMIGKTDRRLGNVVGLLLAALIAISYWHTAITRLSLRIVLTPLMMALVLIYLARVLRENRRGDWIKLGLVLGFSIYTYQAARMFPVVVLIGILALLITNFRQLPSVRRVAFNTLIMGLVAASVAVPMLTYSVEYPEDFWRRTSGRLLGDDVMYIRNENGDIIDQRDPTLEERVQAFQNNLPTLMNNIRNVLLMFNWKGDVAWINGAPNRPAMDVFTGAFLILGLAAWLTRMIRRRDLFDWLLLPLLLVMLMPSALSIAFPIENPSHTRTSGAMPHAYLLAAFAFGLLTTLLVQVVDSYGPRRGLLARRGVVLAVIFTAAVLGLGYIRNSKLIFEDYRSSYLISSKPYSEAGRVLRGFAESEGSYGNAFMIAYPYWWDHRAIGLEAGLVDWPGGIVQMSDLLKNLREAYQRTDRYRLNPDRDLLFFYAPEDIETQNQLQTLFPEGSYQQRMSYQSEDPYNLFRVPRLGIVAFGRLVGMDAAAG